MKVAVVGRAAIIAPFAAAGLLVVPVDPGPGAEAAVRAVADTGTAVIFYTEDLQPYLGGMLKQCSKDALPCLALLPMGAGASGFERLREIVRRAVGADVFGGPAGRG